MPLLLLLVLSLFTCSITQAQTVQPLSEGYIEGNFIPSFYTVHLYTAVTEVSQASYALFLQALEDTNKVAAYQPKATAWKTYLSKAYQDLEEELLFEQGHPDDADAPVQNISYEAAQAYCAWLTTYYNNLDEERRSYKKVKFRLPTVAEWESTAAALSIYSEDYKNLKGSRYDYPWAKTSHEDKKGCIRANFNMEGLSPNKRCRKAQHPSIDGAFFPINVKAYESGLAGLYNVVGNVAEMVEEEGIAKGGSWFHSPSASTISAMQTYTEPTPYIGFRVFMEVLERKTEEKIEWGGAGPPGTAPLTDFLFMDVAEVTNIAWLEYQFWTKVKEPEHYFFTVTDTFVWLERDSTLPVIIDSTGQWDARSAARMNLVYSYHNHPIYIDYPVVGVSHEQAKAFCAWRTDRVNEVFELHPKLLRKYGKVLYRLPTEVEWEYAVKGRFNKNDFPHGYEDLNLKDKKGRRLAQLKWEVPMIKEVGDPVPLVPTTAMMPTSRGFYNMIGNVAEMIDEPNIAKGGSWYHTKEESTITQQVPYQQTEAWLGFRCICEIQH